MSTGGSVCDHVVLWSVFAGKVVDIYSKFDVIVSKYSVTLES